MLYLQTFISETTNEPDVIKPRIFMQEDQLDPFLDAHKGGAWELTTAQGQQRPEYALVVTKNSVI